MTLYLPIALPPSGPANNREVGIDLLEMVRWFNEFDSGDRNWDIVAVGEPSTTTGEIWLYNSGNANKAIIKVASLSANRTYTVPEVSGDASFVMTAGTQTIAGTKTLSSQVITSGGIQSGSNILSDTNNTDDLGSSSVAWKDLYLSGSIKRGSETAITINAGGEVTQPTQPSVLARVASDIPNVTGDGTTYTIIFDTEIYDQSGDFDLGTSTFTASVTGRYLINLNARLKQIASGTHTGISLTIVASNRSHSVFFTAVPALVTEWSQHVSVIVDMDANDTATFQTNVLGSSKVVDVDGGDQTFVSISLIN